MDVLLRPELERYVADKLKLGQFADASGVVNAALDALKEQDELDPEHVACLRREIQRGIDQLDAGQTADFTAASVIREERAKLAKRA